MFSLPMHSATFLKTTKNMTNPNFFRTHIWHAKGCNHTRELRYLVRGSFFFKRKEDTGVFSHKVDRRIVQVPMTLLWLGEYRNAWEEYLIQARKRDVDKILLP